MADAINFKVFLTKEGSGGDSKPEIRRFGIDFDVATNFMYLCEKLQTIYPSLKGKRFTVSWKDDENDEITIGSNEELQLALTETQSYSVRKLYVTLHSNYENEKVESQANNFDIPSASKTKHVGIVCDGCDKGVYGFRYKCVQCPDYDLCLDCEAKGMHPEHCMIRLNVPLQWRSHYGRRLSHHINKFMRKAAPHCSETASPATEAKECPFKNKNFSNVHNSLNQTQSWIDIFSTYLNDWANLPGECSTSNTDTEKPSTSKQDQNKANENPSTQNNEKAPGDTHIEILKNIGESIAQFLDPLGIDVNVQVKNDKPEVKTSTSAENSKQQADSNNFSAPVQQDNSNNSSTLVQQDNSNNSSTPVQQIPISIDKQSKPINQTTQKESTPALDNLTNLQNDSKSEVSIGSGTSKVDDWTLLDTDGIPISASSPVQAESPAVPALQEEQNSTNGNENNNPNLNKKSLYPSMPNVSDNIWHSNPKIQRAVEVMMQMGFSNEGGWLTALLVSKDGDIAKALDVLLVH